MDAFELEIDGADVQIIFLVRSKSAAWATVVVTAARAACKARDGGEI
jgi:hypothetical protein